jgi:hypothetical protein
MCIIEYMDGHHKIAGAPYTPLLDLYLKHLMDKLKITALLFSFLCNSVVYGQNSHLAECLDSLKYIDIKEFNYNSDNIKLRTFESTINEKANGYLSYILFDSLRKDEADIYPVFVRKDSSHCSFAFENLNYYRMKNNFNRFITLIIYDNWNTEFFLLTVSKNGKIIDCISLRNAMAGLRSEKTYSQELFESKIVGNKIIKSECYITYSEKKGKIIDKACKILTFELESSGQLKLINTE